MLPTQQPSVSVFTHQVSGKTPKYTDPTHSSIYKKLSPPENQFYAALSKIPIHDPSHSLREFVPCYKGTIKMKVHNAKEEETESEAKKKWIDHIHSREEENPEEQTFVVLENLLKDCEKTCIMDIKLGIKKKKKESNKKYAESTTNSHRFRINGVQTYFSQTDEEFFVTKYYGQKTTEAEIQSHLAFFFFNGQCINISLLQNVISQVKGLILALLSFDKGQFNSSSLFLSYDGKNPENFHVKLIDFDKYVYEEMGCPDNNIIQGLKNMLGYLINIVDNPEKHEEVLKNRELKLFNSEYNMVPKQKIEQFSKKKENKIDLEK